MMDVASCCEGMKFEEIRVELHNQECFVCFHHGVYIHLAMCFVSFAEVCSIPSLPAMNFITAVV